MVNVDNRNGKQNVLDEFAPQKRVFSRFYFFFSVNMSQSMHVSMAIHLT